jgi:hypothetical protein
MEISPMRCDAPESTRELLDGAFQMFGGVCEDSSPHDRPDQRLYLLFFRRLSELQCDYCRALLTLYETDQLRAAMPVLRALFEVSVAQVFLHQEAKAEPPSAPTGWRIEERYAEALNLLNGGRVKMGYALKKIGWPASQSDIYARLSKLTHVTAASAFAERAVNLEEDPVITSLIGRKDVAGVAAEILRRAAPESAEARQVRWEFVALNAFDVTISSLFTLYDLEAPKSRAPERHWWPSGCVALFEDLASSLPDPAIKQDLLWFRLEPRWAGSKQSRDEMEIGGWYNSDESPSE